MLRIAYCLDAVLSVLSVFGSFEGSDCSNGSECFECFQGSDVFEGFESSEDFLGFEGFECFEGSYGFRFDLCFQRQFGF